MNSSRLLGLLSVSLVALIGGSLAFSQPPAKERHEQILQALEQKADLMRKAGNERALKEIQRAMEEIQHEWRERQEHAEHRELEEREHAERREAEEREHHAEHHGEDDHHERMEGEIHKLHRTIDNLLNEAAKARLQRRGERFEKIRDALQDHVEELIELEIHNRMHEFEQGGHDEEHRHGHEEELETLEEEAEELIQAIRKHEEESNRAKSRGDHESAQEHRLAARILQRQLKEIHEHLAEEHDHEHEHDGHHDHDAHHDHDHDAHHDHDHDAHHDHDHEAHHDHDHEAHHDHDHEAHHDHDHEAHHDRDDHPVAEFHRALGGFAHAFERMYHRVEELEERVHELEQDRENNHRRNRDHD